MGRDAFKPEHASSVSISEVIDTGVNSNEIESAVSKMKNDFRYGSFFVIIKKYDSNRLGGYLDGKMVRHDEKGGF